MIDPSNMPVVADNELLARFIVYSDEKRPDGTVKHKLFLPYKLIELSVNRHREATSEETWKVGYDVAAERNRTPAGSGRRASARPRSRRHLSRAVGGRFLLPRGGVSASRSSLDEGAGFHPHGPDGVSDAGRYRVHARRQIGLRVVFWHPRAGWQRETEVRDVGLGGVGATLDGPLAAGDVVTVAFVDPPLSGRLPIEARVAWVAPGGDGGRVHAGFAFVPRDPAALLALFQLLARAEAGGAAPQGAETT